MNDGPGLLRVLALLFLVSIFDFTCGWMFTGCVEYLPPPVPAQWGEGGCEVCLGDLECAGPAPALCHGVWVQCTGAVADDSRLPVCTSPQGVCNGLNACGDPPWPPY